MNKLDKVVISKNRVIFSFWDRRSFVVSGNTAYKLFIELWSSLWARNVPKYQDATNDLPIGLWELYKGIRGSAAGSQEDQNTLDYSKFRKRARGA